MNSRRGNTANKIKPPDSRRFFYAVIEESGIQIDLIEQGRLEKLRNADLEALTDLMDDPQLYRIVRTMDDIADGGLGNTAAGE